MRQRHLEAKASNRSKTLLRRPKVGWRTALVASKFLSLGWDQIPVPCPLSKKSNTDNWGWNFQISTKTARISTVEEPLRHGRTNPTQTRFASETTQAMQDLYANIQRSNSGESPEKHWLTEGWLGYCLGFSVAWTPARKESQDGYQRWRCRWSDLINGRTPVETSTIRSQDEAFQEEVQEMVGWMLRLLGLRQRPLREERVVLGGLLTQHRLK